MPAMVRLPPPDKREQRADEHPGATPGGASEGQAVAAGERVDVDDRHHDDALDAGSSTRLLQILGGGREELRRRLLLGRRAGGSVDDALHAGHFGMPDEGLEGRATIDLAFSQSLNRGRSASRPNPGK